MALKGELELSSLADFNAGQTAHGFESKIDEIFFASARSDIGGDNNERAAFRAHWLSPYLMHWPEQCWLLFTPLFTPHDQNLIGYLTGCMDTPGAASHLAHLNYFTPFANHYAAYPAHLHINLAPAFQGQGYGGRLMQHFITQARSENCPGIHVVTGADARNISFYAKHGFNPVETQIIEKAELVLLGLSL